MATEGGTYRFRHLILYGQNNGRIHQSISPFRTVPKTLGRIWQASDFLHDRARHKHLPLPLPLPPKPFIHSFIACICMLRLRIHHGQLSPHRRLCHRPPASMQQCTLCVMCHVSFKSCVLRLASVCTPSRTARLVQFFLRCARPVRSPNGGSFVQPTLSEALEDSHAPRSGKSPVTWRDSFVRYFAAEDLAAWADTL